MMGSALATLRALTRPVAVATICIVLALTTLAVAWSAARRGARTGHGAAVVSLHGPRSPNPFTGQRMFVDRDSRAYWARQSLLDQGRLRDARLLAKVSDNPTAHWFGDWPDGHGGTFADVSFEVNREARAGALPVLVAYDIPARDCGSYSSGGARTAAEYARFIDAMARAIGSHRVAVILEPDALAELDCLPPSERRAYPHLLQAAVARLTRNPLTAVYIDAGNRGWQSPATMARRLRLAGIDRARGFALNVSNFDATAAEIRYGTAISRLLGGAHFVIDTSRNGRGDAPHAAWCNPSGRGLGPAPTARTADPLADAYLWIKAPGESDGACGRGAPAAGVWWLAYALRLARNAAF